MKRNANQNGNKITSIWEKTLLEPWDKYTYWIDPKSCAKFLLKLVLLFFQEFNIASGELWCWRRILRVPWTARRSNQSILKEISPWCSLEGLMLKLKLQYFGHLMWRVDSFEKTLMLGGIRRTLGVGDGQGGLAFCDLWDRRDLDMTERLNWTELNWETGECV